MNTAPAGSTAGKSKDTLYCSFCGKSQHEVEKLIAGATVFICSECVELSMDIIREARSKAVFDKAEEADIEALMAIESTVGSRLNTTMSREEMIREICDGHIFVLKIGGAVCGYIMCFGQPGMIVYIGALAVHPQFRGQGLAGQALMDVFVRFHKAKLFQLHVHPDNHHAVALYTKHGFSVERVLPDFFGDGEPRLLMTRRP